MYCIIFYYSQDILEKQKVDILICFNTESVQFTTFLDTFFGVHELTKTIILSMSNINYKNKNKYE